MNENDEVMIIDRKTAQENNGSWELTPLCLIKQKNLNQPLINRKITI